MVVRKALKRTWAFDKIPERTPNNSTDDLSSVTSQLIHDIFGGEILKTRNNKGWHFYNRINGERIDFTILRRSKSSKKFQFEDLPSTPYETYKYFEPEDYSTFFTRFIRAFEEAIGLRKCQPGYSA
jgi:hypothetical protein